MWELCSLIFKVLSIPSNRKDKLTEMRVDSFSVFWITDYLRERPQFVSLGNCVSGTWMSSMGAWRGTVLGVPFHIVYSRLQIQLKYKYKSCQIQKYLADPAIVACIRNGQESEYRDLVKAFSNWSHKTNLIVNTSKTKEMIFDDRCLLLSRKQRSLDIWSNLLQMFYQSMVTNVLLYAGVCCLCSNRSKTTRGLDKLVRKAGSVIGARLGMLG